MLPSVVSPATNNAVASGGGSAVSPAASDTVNVLAPRLALAKGHTGNATVGGPLTYTLAVSNTGSAATVAAIPVTVADPLAPGLQLTSASGPTWLCAPGPTVQCSTNTPIAAGGTAPPITVLVTILAAAYPSVTNTATTQGGGASNTATASNTVPVTGTSSLTLQKSHTGDFTVGSPGTYTLLLGNSSGIPTNGPITLVDTLPAGLTYASSSGTGWTCAAAAQTVTCSYAATIAAGATAPPLTLVVNVLAGAVPGVVNSATASGGGSSGPVTATDPTAVNGLPNLVVTKSHTDTFVVGQSATYTVAVSNNGSSPTTTAPVTVTDAMPAGLTYTAASGTGWACQAGPIAGPAAFKCTYSGGAIAPPGGSLPNLLLTVTPTASGTLVNAVSATGAGAPNTANATDTTVILPPSAPPALTLQKSHTGNFQIGRPGTFTLGVGNSGSVATAGAITLTDTLPAGLTYAGASGTNWTCPAAPAPSPVSCTYSAAIPALGIAAPLTFNVNVLPTATSPLTNTALAAGGGSAVSPNASDTVNIDGPLLSINKSHSGTATVGGQLTYTLAVSNVGAAPTIATVPLTVTDPLAPGLQLVSASGTGWTCAPGTTVSCTTTTPIPDGGVAPPISVVVTVLAAAYPTVKNTATTQGGGAPNAPSASDTVTVAGTAALTLSKVHAGSSFAAGGQGTYTLIVGNSEAIPTSGTITVTDPLPGGLTYVSAGGTGWTCAFAAPNVTCTTPSVIAPGGNSSPITLVVGVAASAAPAVTNVASATGGGTTNVAQATDTVPVVAASLALSKTHTGNFAVGQPGTFTLVATNTGSTATVGPTVVADTLPNGLTYASATGTGWACAAANPQTVTCTYAAALAPGASAPPISLTVNVAAAAVPSATNTATATNGAAGNPATATDTVTVTGRAQFSGVSKLVNGVHGTFASTGDIVQYAIAFTNSGGAAATNVVVNDTFPAGIVPSAASVKLNGSGAGFTATVIGQTLSVAIPSVAAGATATITVDATVTASASGNGLINTAQITAGNAPTQTTGPATVLVGTSNIVYDGSLINAQGQPTFPVSNANVALVDPNSRQPASLPTPGTNVNPNNANPFATTQDGQFSFALSGQHFGAPGTTSTFELVAAANGYTNRRIQAVFTTDATGFLYNLTLTAQDGLPLANPGAYTLTKGPVTFTSVANVFGNIPMFGSSLTVTKTADRSVASVGNRVVWTMTVQNSGQAPLANLVVTDVLPAGIAYAPGTARIGGIPVEPTISGHTLTWRFPDSQMQAQTTRTFVIATVVAAGTTNGTYTNLVTANASPLGSTIVQSAQASANVLVTSGAFGNQFTILGRVVIATPNDDWSGQLTGVPSVRIIMEDGSSVVTDKEGRYSFPNVRPGLHVLHLDATSLPAGVHAFNDRRYDSPRSTERLVHGLSDTTLIQDVNFEVQGK